MEMEGRERPKRQRWKDETSTRWQVYQNLEVRRNLFACVCIMHYQGHMRIEYKYAHACECVWETYCIPLSLKWSKLKFHILTDEEKPENPSHLSNELVFHSPSPFSSVLYVHKLIFCHSTGLCLNEGLSFSHWYFEAVTCHVSYIAQINTCQLQGMNMNLCIQLSVTCVDRESSS